MVDDIRIWGRPLAFEEVRKLWGNGMGDIGPRLTFDVQSPTFGDTIDVRVHFNQIINDFDANTDLEFSNLNLISSNVSSDSNLSYDLVFQPLVLSESNFTLKLKEGSITGAYGSTNSEITKLIEFRPHRIREDQLIVWWDFNEGIGTTSQDASPSSSYDGNTTAALWASSGKFGNSHVSFDGNDSRSFERINGIGRDLTACTISFWVNPSSTSFHLFSIENSAPSLSISLNGQRALFSLTGLNQQSLPGTNGDEFWASAYLTLNQWSHLAFTYNLENRRVRSYVNGIFDGEASFANSQAIPFSQTFRLGPADGTHSSVSVGEIDDFRLYDTELNATEVLQLHGKGYGDFYTRTIEFSFNSDLQNPKIINVHFLEDGFPVDVGSSFRNADLLSSNSNPSVFLPPISKGVYEVQLIPNNPSSALPLELSITGSGVSTLNFGETFPDTNVTIPYNIASPQIISPAFSNWAVGVQGSFAFKTQYGTSLSISGAPSWLDFNTSTGILSGTPSDVSDTTIVLSVTNSIGTEIQNHNLRIYNPNDFSARLQLSPVGATSSTSPKALPGLILQLDSSKISDGNGSIIGSWQDSSGLGNSLDRVRGTPRVFYEPSLDGKKVVQFDGLSQLYSTYDFGSVLSEYSIFALARHTGDRNGTIIGSVGTDWVFGFGNGSSAYWKMGSFETQSSQADQQWHLLAGTLRSDGHTTLWRDQVKIFDSNLSSYSNTTPRFLSLGGSQANENYSNSQIAEVLLYNRVLSDSEISDLQNYLNLKWLGGAVENFPLLVRLSYASHPDFDLNSFSDPVAGGDLRFYDQNHNELLYEIDEWNVSGESTIWVNIPSFNDEDSIFAYWGNDNNTSIPSYRTDGSVWSNYEGVWHLKNGSDSSSNSRTATTNAGMLLNNSSLIGTGGQLDGLDDDLSINSYLGISGNNPRSVSMWMKSSDLTGGLLGWGSASNHWNLAWNSTGPRIETNASFYEQGIFSLNDNQWHHVAFSYNGLSNDLNSTKIYVDGRVVDAPASSNSGTFNTVLGSALKIGSSYNTSSHWSGSIDEVRISSNSFGDAWFQHSYNNQKASSSFLDYDLSYLTSPAFTSDLNLTAVNGQPFSFQVRTQPPATSYSLVGSASLTINSATGVISGNPDWLGDQNFTVVASNSAGDANSTLLINSLATPTNPIITAGTVKSVDGRNALIDGVLVSTGGASNSVTLYYGQTDGNETIINWNFSKSLGANHNQGVISAALSGLNSGETYYYRFESNNGVHSSWSNLGSFSTLYYDQGTLRFSTGLNEDGTGAGIYWDKNGSGEVKVKDANISLVNYIAPDGKLLDFGKIYFSFYR